MNDKRPIFKQIQNEIMGHIADGRYRRGGMIPSEPEYCRMFHTTRMTVRRAIDELVQQGELYRVNGKGTFVSHIDLQKTYQRQGFSQNMRALGIRPTSRMLLSEERTAPRKVLEELRLPEDERMLYLERLRMADYAPVAIERVWLSLTRFPKLAEYDFSVHSLYEMLRSEYGLEAGYSHQKLNAVAVTGGDAKLLFGKNSGIALSMHGVDYDHIQRPIAVTDALYHGRNYTLDIMIK